jgi:hypothetical protein
MLLAHLLSPSIPRRNLPIHLALAIMSPTHPGIRLSRDIVRTARGNSFRNILDLRMEEDLVERRLKPYSQTDGEGRIYRQPQNTMEKYPNLSASP